MAPVDVVLVEDDTPLAHIIVVALEQYGLRVSHLDGGAMLSGEAPESIAPPSRWLTRRPFCSRATTMMWASGVSSSTRTTSTGAIAGRRGRPQLGPRGPDY